MIIRHAADHAYVSQQQQVQFLKSVTQLSFIRELYECTAITFDLASQFQ